MMKNEKIKYFALGFVVALLIPIAIRGIVLAQGEPVSTFASGKETKYYERPPEPTPPPYEVDRFRWLLFCFNDTATTEIYTSVRCLDC